MRKIFETIVFVLLLVMVFACPIGLIWYIWTGSFLALKISFTCGVVLVSFFIAYVLASRK